MVQWYKKTRCLHYAIFCLLPEGGNYLSRSVERSRGMLRERGQRSLLTRWLCITAHILHGEEGLHYVSQSRSVLQHRSYNTHLEILFNQYATEQAVQSLIRTSTFRMFFTKNRTKEHIDGYAETGLLEY